MSVKTYMENNFFVSAPKYIKYPVLRKNDSLAVVDWSASFILNGRLLEYLIIMDDGNTVYSGVSSVHGLERSSPQESENPL